MSLSLEAPINRPSTSFALWDNAVKDFIGLSNRGLRKSSDRKKSQSPQSPPCNSDKTRFCQKGLWLMSKKNGKSNHGRSIKSATRSQRFCPTSATSPFSRDTVIPSGTPSPSSPSSSSGSGPRPHRRLRRRLPTVPTPRPRRSRHLPGAHERPPPIRRPIAPRRPSGTPLPHPRTPQPRVRGMDSHRLRRIAA